MEVPQGTVGHPAEAYRPARTHPLGPPPILVVDDDRSTEATTAAWLAEAGYATAVEGDGDAVLRLVRAELTRLVVSELHISCAEGRCVIAALKRERLRLPRLRVLAYTRFTSPADDAWALAAGSDAVLHKSGSTAALLREVRRLDGGDDAEGPRSGLPR
jgi:CheY-like chemotaxis protein